MREIRIRPCEVRCLAENRVPDLVDETAQIAQDILEVHEPEPLGAESLELFAGNRLVKQHLPAHVLDRIEPPAGGRAA
jgi:hypothetical protein